MTKYDPRLEPPPAPGDIHHIEFVMAELKPGKISIGWRLNGQSTCHFFFCDMMSDQAAETMKRILDQEITDKDIAKLNWQAVYLPVEKGKKH